MRRFLFLIIGLAITEAQLNAQQIDSLGVAPLSSTQALVTWHGSGATSYSVERRAGSSGSFAPVASVIGSSFSFIDQDLTPDEDYTYRVKATSAGGTAYSDLVSVTTVANLSDLPLDHLILWLNADVQVNKDASGAVSAWNDLSGCGNNATQFNAGNKPSSVPEALNGHPVIHFDGNSSYLSMPAGFDDFSSGLTAFVVAKPTNNGSWQRYFDLGIGSANDNILFSREFGSGNLIYQAFNGSYASTSLVATGAITQNQFQILSVNQGGGIVSLSKNGSRLSQGTAAAIPTATRTTNYIGKSNWPDALYQGDMAEIMIFNHSLSDTETQAILHYLNQKYEIIAPPPAPEDISATAISSSQVNLLWSQAAASPDSFEIERSTDEAGPFEEIAAVSGKISAFIDNDLAAGVTYYYQVRARGFGVYSDYSAIAAATTPAGEDALPFDHLLAWFKADDGASADSLDRVSRWIDASGHGSDAAQSAAGSQPTWVANTLNGNPILRFDGSSSYLSMPPGFSDFSSGLTALVVAKPTNNGSWQRYFDLGIGSANNNILFSREFGSDTLIYQAFNGGSVGTTLDATNAITENQFQILSVNQGSGTVALSRNGARLSQGTASAIPVVTRTTNYLGKSNWPDALFQGDIAEVLIFNASLSDAEAMNVLSYLNLKYHVLPAPDPPASLQSSAVSSTRLSISWNSSADPTAFVIERRIGATGSFVTLASVAGTIRSYRDQNVSGGTSYSYRITATKLGRTGSSSIITVQTPVVPTIYLTEPSDAVLLP